MKQEKQGTGMSGVQGYRPIPLTIDDDYTFLDRGRWFRLASGAFRRFAYGVLRIYNRLFFGLRVQELLPDLRGVGHQGRCDDDAFFFADGTVKFINQAVHRRIGLLPVYMP